MNRLPVAAQRFLRYVPYNTQSDSESETVPSSPSIKIFAEALADECAAIGLSDVKINSGCCVTAVLPSNAAGKKIPAVGFIAHTDTSPDAPGNLAEPKIEYSYGGGKIRLNDNVSLTPKMFPHLKNYIGQDIICTDGNALLGADNKAGIASIMTAMEFFLQNKDVPHGKVVIAFTPDEEIGRGTDCFDVKLFGADFAYTVDGGEIGELETESFNAAKASFVINGASVHPGYAKDVMKNAALIAAKMIGAFPRNETPSETENREGFYHLTEVGGDVGRAWFTYIIRDFDAENFALRKKFTEKLTQDINDCYGEGTAVLKIKDEYRNMADVLKNFEYVVTIAERAMKLAGVEPLKRAIRGGTDGARLSFMGLPCPNIFAGGHNFHGPYEYLPVPSLLKSVEVIINIVREVYNG
ncbi:MAG: peptidase T [Defluviitaleaceae bacterium]|nr:peptidase T [Defluviitaleaceae bacterium]